MFPGLGLGVIVCRAATMPPSLFIAAARALAKLADPTDPAKGLLPDISRLREVSATVAVDVINTAMAAGHRPGAGRRPDRGRPRRDVVAGVPPDQALTAVRDLDEGARAWRRRWRRSWSTRWSRSGSGRSTASSATRPTRSSTRCAGTRRTSSSCTSETRRRAPSPPARTPRSRVDRPPSSGRRGPAACTCSTASTTASATRAPVFAIATHIPSTEIGSGYFQETNPEAIFSGCTNYVALVSVRRRRCRGSPSSRCRPPSSSAASG